MRNCVSAGWRRRGYVSSVRLLIIDEIHLLGEDRGPVLEVLFIVVTTSEDDVRRKEEEEGSARRRARRQKGKGEGRRRWERKRKAR